MVTAEIDNWFKENRRNYRWPLRCTTEHSENEINRLAAKVRKALQSHDFDDLCNALVDVYLWKSGRGTDTYRKNLKSCGIDYLQELLKMRPLIGTRKLESVIRHLEKVKGCNLPVASAMASFLYGREDIPVIDYYVGQFFSRKFNRGDFDTDGTDRVLQWIAKIDFKIGRSGNKSRNQWRLAVYDKHRKDFEANLRKYIDELVPECGRIANALNDGKENEREFYPIDVEMAIFSWATDNRKLFWEWNGVPLDKLPSDSSRIVRRL